MAMNLEELLEKVNQLSPDEKTEFAKFVEEWLYALRAEKRRKSAEALVIRETAHREEIKKSKIRYRPRIEWMRANADKYLNQWFAFEENELFAHGTDRDKVCQEALAKGAKMVCLFRIGKDRKSSFGD